jgi:hypothetical protein
MSAQQAIAGGSAASAHVPTLDPKALELSEKRRLRKEKNKESARECRKRKRDKKAELLKEITFYEAENLQLRLKLQGADVDAARSDSAYITNQLETLVKEGSSELDIQELVKELGEKFSDYGRDRRSAINFHLSQLRRCLQPTQTTRAIVFLMSCAISFHHPNGDVITGQEGELATMWYNLLDTVRPNAEQRKQMFAFTIPSVTQSDVMEELYKSTDACDALLDRLEAIILNKNNSFDSEIANIQTIMSSRQTAKFILWIKENPACMQMLEQLWPHMTYPSTRSTSVDSSSSVEKLSLSEKRGESTSVACSSSSSASRSSAPRAVDSSSRPSKWSLASARRGSLGETPSSGVRTPTADKGDLRGTLAAGDESASG